MHLKQFRMSNVGSHKASFIQLRLSVENGWLPVIAIYMILFVLYHNKLQFTGFYEGPNQQKLPHSISVTFLMTFPALFIATRIVEPMTIQKAEMLHTQHFCLY